MPTLGRNDPCHCGSGKKYKKCCIDKDAEAARASATAAGAVAAAPPQAPAPPPARAEPVSPTVLPGEKPAPFSNDSPEMARWDAFFDRFGKAALDEQFTMALEAVRSEPAFDSEWCFELLNELTDPGLGASRDEDVPMPPIGPSGNSARDSQPCSLRSMILRRPSRNSSTT